MPRPVPTRIRHYDLHERLGAGASGVVYRAFDTRLHRPVVIKLLHDVREDHGDLDRLLEEARLASSIDHPNVCTVHYVGVEDGQPFLVMQYVAGRTLLERLEAAPLGDAFARSVGVQLASGLAAAHAHGVLHRDLKPANVIVMDDGRVIILDFGLARRVSLPEPTLPSNAPDEAPGSSRFGTTAYMAPEQFVTRRSTEQSDLWALGVILFEMVTGRHPFRMGLREERLLVHAIQNDPLPSLAALRPDLEPGFAALIEKMLAKQPDARYHRASDVRDALQSLQPEEVLPVPAPLPPTEEARGSLLGLLTGRRTEPASLPANALAVLPFEQASASPCPPHYGNVLSEAVATRFALVTQLVVRPPRLRSALRAVGEEGVLDMARKLSAAYLLTGALTCTPGRVYLTWRLTHAESDAVVTGGTAEAAGSELSILQSLLVEEVFAAVEASGALPITTTPQLTPTPSAGGLQESTEEVFLGARALLNNHATRSSHEGDLLRAIRTFEEVIEEAPTFAPAYASVGVALTRYVRFGFGGAGDLLAARHHLDRALDLDPSNIEAKLYRAYTMLWRGEKEQARRDVQFLMQTAGFDAEVQIGVGVVLHLDGLLDDALAAFGQALRLNPSLGARIYNLRARVLIYLQRPGDAWREIMRGLSLEPRHTLLRTTQGVWHLRHGELPVAIQVLEQVVTDDPNLRLAHPTLAIAYHAGGQAERAAALMTEELLARSSADCEMAYRIATYYAVAEQTEEALLWLRKAIYLGNHNATWFERNPHWAGIRGEPAIRQTLDDLAILQRQQAERWKKLLRSATG